MYDTIILSGGSTRGYYQLGCLYKNKDRISSVKRYIGTSVGGLISLLLVCGFDIPDIIKLSLFVKCKLPEGTEWLSAVKIFAKEYGILDSNPYIEILEVAIKRKYGYIPTMKQLYDLTGKELILVTSRVTTYESVYISHTSFPDLPCTLATDMSARIPLLFTPILYNGDLYVDGGLCEHMAVDLINPDEKTLCIYTWGKKLGQISSIKDISPYKYLVSLINTGMKYKYTNLTGKSNTTIYMISGKGPGINATPQQAIIMFLFGMFSEPLQSS